jgi:hypothetical protein
MIYRYVITYCARLRADAVYKATNSIKGSESSSTNPREIPASVGWISQRRIHRSTGGCAHRLIHPTKLLCCLMGYVVYSRLRFFLKAELGG